MSACRPLAQSAVMTRFTSQAATGSRPFNLSSKIRSGAIGGGAGQAWPVGRSEGCRRSRDRAAASLSQPWSGPSRFTSSAASSSAVRLHVRNRQGRPAAYFGRECRKWQFIRHRGDPRAERVVAAPKRIIFLSACQMTSASRPRSRCTLSEAYAAAPVKQGTVLGTFGRQFAVWRLPNCRKVNQIAGGDGLDCLQQSGARGVLVLSNRPAHHDQVPFSRRQRHMHSRP
jgi:hypothetical protein